MHTASAAIQVGIVLLAINLQTSSRTLLLPLAADRYTLSARSLGDDHVMLNGSELALGVHDELPSLHGQRVAPGRQQLAPESISFLAVANAHNPDCR